VHALDDRVPLWVTLNEPWVVTDGGYLHGVLAPGHRSFYEPPIASHNLLRAHGAAVQAYRGEGRHRIGLVVNLEPKYPASSSEEDRAATARAEAYMNRQYLDPVFLGRYPAEMAVIWGDAWRDWPQRDFDLIGQKLDFLGINYYTRSVTRFDPTSLPLRAASVRQEALHTETGWEVCPQALTDVLNWVRTNYPALPLYITENGAAFADPCSSTAPLPEDRERNDYLHAHLRAVHTAMQAGCDVHGYFVWSLLDNLEWAHGFSKRFGIVHVDFGSQRRTAKASARFYKRVIESNGAVLAEPAR
jgi:beta-glucosidase